MRTSIRIKSFNGGTTIALGSALLQLLFVIDVDVAQMVLVFGELLVLLELLRVAGVEGGEGREWLEGEGVTTEGGGLHSMTVAA